MKDNTVAVMGYPNKPNKYRFNSNRKTKSNSNYKSNKNQ